MPPTQSPPRATRGRSRASPLVPKPPPKRQAHSPDVLELSSSDDTPLPPPHKQQKPVPSLTIRKKLKPKPRSQIQSTDVIEISSDEDEVLFSTESIIANLRSQVKNLTQERDEHQNNCSSLATELAKSRAELNEVKTNASQHQSTKGKLVLNSSEVEDALNCEICTRRMYTPYLLPECGHTFCLSCLRDWFGTSHARFMQANPHWNQNAMASYVTRLQAILRPEYLAHPQLYHQLQQLQQPVPEYTCPTCRKRVYRRPVEVYALKSLVRTISSVDEEEKANIPPDQPFTERRHGQLVVVDPWIGFSTLGE